MGRVSRRGRYYPKLLGQKLLGIRTALGLSQNGMLKRLGSPDGLLGTSISGYERGVREPPLLILLEYARIAGVCVDTLLDDEMSLPSKIPNTPKHRGKHVLKT
jgi:transcriptional regulator with XRE-family HTH domain